MSHAGVSIPQSGFLVVKPEQFDVYLYVNGSFNPSVGILGGQTRQMEAVGEHPEKFQSLSRDSWWSNPCKMKRKEL